MIKFFKEFNFLQKAVMVGMLGTSILYAVSDNRLLLLAGAVEFIGLILSIKD